MTMRLICRAAFTLIEVLIVVAIVMLLLSLAGIVAKNAWHKARLTHTRGLISQIRDCMTSYSGAHRDYPPTEHETWPQPDCTAGVELDYSWLKDCGAGSSFSKDDFDPADSRFFVDPWKHRIRYRKSSPDRILIWSLGPDGVDQIGADAAGHRERLGDDITNVDSDH